MKAFKLSAVLSLCVKSYHNQIHAVCMQAIYIAVPLSISIGYNFFKVIATGGCFSV